MSQSKKRLSSRKRFVLSRRHGRRRSLRWLFAETLERRLLLATVTSVDPLANSHAAPVSTDVAATFDQNINPATATPRTFAVHSMQGGPLIDAAATVNTTGATVMLDPTSNFFPGELVQASVTSAIQSTASQPANPHVWQFRTAVPFGNGEFSDGSQSLGNHQSSGVALGDLDGDGDLDAFVINFNQGNRVWLNDGGLFSDSRQSLGNQFGFDVSLGDLDGDGDLDAFVANGGYQANRVWLNNGDGLFDSGQSLGNSRSWSVSLGDLDGDGDLDAFVGNRDSGSSVWLNNGDGLFNDSGQRLGNRESFGVALGDLDGDGDLDAFVANNDYQADHVWLNNGSGSFSDSGQALGDGSGLDVALGDLDGDGDLDAFVANGVDEPNRVWINDGGLFTESQSLGNSNSWSISLGDLDADGDLDAFVTNIYAEPNRVWTNDGGVFSDSGQLLGNHYSDGASLGDLDGDGDLDAFVANEGYGQGNRVWLGNSRLSLAIMATDATKPEGGSGNTPFTFTVTRSGDTSGATAVDYQVSGSGANPADVADFGGALPSGVVNFAANETTKTISINVSGDEQPEANEDFTVTLSNTTPAAQITIATANGTIRNDDAAELASLVAAKDNTLYESTNGSLSNGAGHYFFVGQTGGRSGPPTRRGLISFDIAGAGIPAGSTIISATLTLNMSRSMAGPQNVSLHEVTTDWGQGTSDASGNEDGGGGGGGPSTPNDATWIHTFFNTSTWSNPGGDFNEAASATTPVDAVGSYQWSGPGMLADVQDWLDVGGNFGWIVRGNETSSATTKRFDSKEHPTAANRPLLAIEYGLPVASTSLSVAATDANKAEGDSGNTPFTFTVTRGGDASGATSVNYAVSGTSASPANAADFGGTLPSGVVNFAASETSQTITIDISGDAVVEADESFIVALSNPTPAATQIVAAAASGTIQNDDEPLPSVTLAVDNATIPEATGVAAFTATLSAATALPVTVELSLSGAASAADFTASGTQIVIGAGATSGSVTVTAVQDATDEPNETVIADIASVTGGTENGTQQVTTTILDDDDAPVPDVTLAVDNAVIDEPGGVATFEVTLSEATTVPVTVDLGIGGTATAADDYTASGNHVVFEAGTTRASITVTAVDDEIDESDETVTVDITSVTGGNEAGLQRATTTITDDDDPPGFTVTSLTATTSGFVAEFATDLDASKLNLYDTQAAGLGPADAVLRGPSGVVAGSLVAGPGTRSITFIKSGDPLEAGDYAVTLRSAAEGFKDVGGQLLDGNDDGAEGDDYENSFNVVEAAEGAIKVSLPDFVRGPGQDVNLPADMTSGIPVTISEGSNVRTIDFRVRYDPAMLEITGATVGGDMPAGATVIVNTNTPGLAIMVFFSSNSLPAGRSTFVNLQASVPDSDPSGIYSSQQVLDLHSATISDGNDNESLAVVDDAFHLVSYFADVSGNGRINASDAAQVARFAALIDTGFTSSLLADPIVVGDLSGNRRVNAADASRVAQFAALIDVPEIPPIPAGIRITGNPTATPEDLQASNATPHDLGTQIIVAGAPTVLTGGGITGSSSTTTFNVVQTFSSQGVGTAAIDELAVDAVMSDLIDATSAESGEEERIVALEDAIDKLLSVLK